MLEKTMQLIKDIKPGTFIPQDNIVYDESEIKALGLMLQKLVYAPSQVRKRLQQLGVTVTPSNFYSVIPTISDIENCSAAESKDGDFYYIFDDNVLAAELDNLLKYSAEFKPSVEEKSVKEFFWKNSQFSYSDAMAYYCMIRHYRPKTIIEIGAGYSSLVALDALEKNGTGSLVCVEPYPREFLKHDTRITLIQKTIQLVGADFFHKSLVDGDFIFIDSTHTVKYGSDCVEIYLKILPYLTSNVIIHAHDIQIPKNADITALRDLQRYWNEMYLLYAYLVDNKRTTVLYGSSYNYIKRRAVLESFMNGQYGSGGGSLWFRQRPNDTGRQLR